MEKAFTNMALIVCMHWSDQPLNTILLYGIPRYMKPFPRVEIT